jgi:hypothetical protein
MHNLVGRNKKNLKEPPKPAGKVAIVASQLNQLELKTYK